MEWTVLVVDDEAEIQRTLRNFLAISGFHALTAGNGEAALEIVRNQKVDVVLCDIKMPGMDGLEVLEKIREIDFSIQVIMITGFSTFDSTIAALEKGAADYVLKPFENLDDVLKLIGAATEKLARWKTALAGSSRRNRGGGKTS